MYWNNDAEAFNLYKIQGLKNSWNSTQLQKNLSFSFQMCQGYWEKRVGFWFVTLIHKSSSGGIHSIECKVEY